MENEPESPPPSDQPAPTPDAAAPPAAPVVPAGQPSGDPTAMATPAAPPPAPAPDEHLEASVRAALPDQGLSGYRDIELGTNIGTAVVAHAVLEERGIEATFLELGSDLADPDANQHAVRVPAADEAAARAIVVEVTTAS